MPATASAQDSYQRSERRGLVVSLVASGVIGVSALVWGVVVGAGVLVFDGVYSLAGIALSAASLLASRVSYAPPSGGFPFGRSGAVPQSVAVQGAALAATLVYAAVEAVGTIVAGGSPAPQSVLLAYGVVTTVLSVGVVLLLRRIAPGSELVGAEVAGWFTGALLSLLVAVGGGVGLILDRAGSPAAAYVDPVLVLVAVAATAYIPVRLVRTSLHELLEGAPPPQVAERIAAILADAEARFGLPEPVVRSTKLGRRLYVEVDFVVPGGTWSVDDEDAVRRYVVGRLDDMPLDVWATVEVTADESLL
jgi:predicted Co/Zn/Cd cation transporter (cation efflux family)